MPITSSVGAGGANRRSDTAHVQAALIIWRPMDGLGPIKLDGLVGPEIIGAITDYQRRRHLPVDGRVDPTGPTLSSLEKDVVPALEAQVRSAVLSVLTGAQRSYAATLPAKLAHKLSIAISAASLLRGSPSVSALAPSSYLKVGFAPRPFVFAVAAAAAPAAAAAVEAIMLALLVTTAALILIQMMPTLGRAAEELIRKLQVLMAKLLDGIKSAIDGVEDLVRRNTQAGMRCSEELILFRQLSSQLITELSAPRSPDPIKQQQTVIRISNLFQKWKAALQAVLDCLAANGAV